MSDDDLDKQLWDLAVANRILEREGVVDAYGHVSIRHPLNPERYFLSCSRSPGIVSRDDLMEFTLDNEPIDQRGRPIYSERPIHGALYEARPDVMSVIHNHSPAVIPFGVTSVPLRQITHTSGGMPSPVPVWDIRAKFGDTNHLVTTQEQGRDLAQTMGDRTVALMRGHGCAIAAETLKRAVHIAIYLETNARLLMDALRIGGDITFMSEGEVALTAEMTGMPTGVVRTWDYWCNRADLEGV